MKKFTARDLNEKRQEIREAIQEGGCIIQFKHCNKEIDLEAVALPIDEYEKLKNDEK